MDQLPLVARAAQHGERTAMAGQAGRFSYRNLLDRSALMATVLLDESDDLREARIACLVPAGFDHVCTQWGIWRAGGIAVPLSLSATEPEIRYTLSDADASCVVVTEQLKGRVESICADLGLRLLLVDEIARVGAAAAPSRPPLPKGGWGGSEPRVALPTIDADRRAMILYTSGTTGQPKGVVSTHATIQAQIETLFDAWKWEAGDSIPLFLPLHHIHGIINVMSCALWAGATIEPFERFDMETVLQRVAARAYSLFMAVPTIYVKIIQHLETLDEAKHREIVEGFAKMRLMVSGSAALPDSVHRRWAELTGQQLLERYGMTEIGMALSNPYAGERRPGTVGQPLPGVELRLMSDSGEVMVENESGQIQVRGPSVFGEYWQRHEATTAAFDDGWFQTGDIAIIEDGYYRIMGRQSVDIIKSGGYKLSALEIESVLLDHPAICECAVVGVADETWGEIVAAAVVVTAQSELDVEAIRTWCADRLSSYKIPRQWKAVDSLPRNAMGKVTKPAVRKLLATNQQ